MGLLDDARRAYDEQRKRELKDQEAAEQAARSYVPQRPLWAVELADALNQLKFPSAAFEEWGVPAGSLEPDPKERAWTIAGEETNTRLVLHVPWEFWAVTTTGRWFWDAQYASPTSDQGAVIRVSRRVEYSGSGDLGPDQHRILRLCVRQAIERLDKGELSQPGVLTVPHHIYVDEPAPDFEDYG